jgi:hypothetical protein
MFRIENQSVIEKSKSQEVAKSKRASKWTSPVSSTSTSPAAFDPLVEDRTIESQIIKHSRTHTDRQGGFSNFLAPAYSMSSALEERARCFFAANSVMWSPTFNLVEGMFTQTSGDEHLLASINAVGLASFAHSVHAPELMVRARQDYILALRLTHLALRSPVEAKKDSTLFAVMILSVFETIAGTSEHSLVAWTEHIQGAAAIIKLRGLDQFKTDTGRRLFQQVTSNLMISCLTRTAPMPAHMIELREASAHIIDTSQPAWKLATIIVDFTNFRAALRMLEIAGPREVIDQALDFDRRFLEVFNDAPESWTYEIGYTDENPHLVWRGLYHVYQDTFASQLWNGMRTCRIMLHETILDQLLISANAMVPIFTEAEARAHSNSSVAISLEMQSGILGSIPYGRSNSPQDGRSPHAMTYFILWPLYLVAAMDLSTDEIRNWVTQRLRLIAEEVGIQQAAVMANFLSGDALPPHREHPQIV